jgi:hypothetical protein
MPFLNDETIERCKAIVLVETIKGTPGGHKLNFENILFLVTHFEADYLPGDERTMMAMVERILKEQAEKSRANQSVIGGFLDRLLGRGD